MRAVFMRHAESSYNVKDLVNQDPKVKVKITDRGKKQAEEAGKKLRDNEFELIFVSDFLRTQETAKIVNGNRKIKIVKDKRINEIAIGLEGEGVEVYRKARADSGERIAFFKIDKNFESFFDVKIRVEKFIDYLRKSGHENVLVVTHEVCVQAVKSILDGVDEEKAFSLPVENCGYFEYKI